MAAKKGYKRMTQREKDAMARTRAQLREEGILPQKKKPLNRKKYIEESCRMYEAAGLGNPYELAAYLGVAIGMMIGWGSYRPTAETVGCAKAMRIAAKLAGRGRESLSKEAYEDFFEHEIMPIYRD